MAAANQTAARRNVRLPQSLLKPTTHGHDNPSRPGKPIQHLRRQAPLPLEKIAKRFRLQSRLAGELSKGAVARMNGLPQMPGKRVFGSCLLQPLMLEVKRLQLACDRLAILPDSEKKFG